MRTLRFILLLALLGTSVTWGVGAQEAPPRDPLNPAPNRGADEGIGPFKTLVIRGATVIDGTGGPPHSPMDIVVQGNRITSVRSAGTPGLPLRQNRNPQNPDHEIDGTGGAPVENSVLVVRDGRIVAAGSAAAHHAFSAEFDADRPVLLQGTVTKTEWINPHSWIHVEVKGPDGKVASWAIECGAPNSLLRRGLNKTSIPAGTELVIDGYQARDGSTTAVGRSFLLEDGQRLFLAGSAEGIEEPAR